MDSVYESILKTNFTQTSELQISTKSTFSYTELYMAFALIPFGIKRLNVSYLNLDVKGIQVLCEFLPRFHLQELDLSNNPITDAGVWNLLDFIRQSKTLSSLKLSKCEITGDGIWPLLTLLSIMDFKYLDLSFNSLRVTGINYIQDYLIHNPKIEVLILRSTELSSGDVESLLAAALKAKQSREIDLRDNQKVIWRELPANIHVDMLNPMK